VKLFKNRKHMLRKLPRHAVVAEIGVGGGDFSQDILTITSPEKLHLIDPWKLQVDYHPGVYGHGMWQEEEATQGKFDQYHDRVQDRFRSLVDEGVVEIHREYSHDALAAFPDDYFDWVYIDGNHDYEVVKAEFELVLRKVKPGGLITGDDYMTTAANLGVEYGVKRAVDEFCDEHGWELFFVADKHWKGANYQSFGLRPRS